MQKYVTLEQAEKKLQPLLIIDFTSGKKNHSVDLIAQFFDNKTENYILTKKKHPASLKTISSLSVHFLDRLNGSLPYSIIFIDDSKQKKNILMAISKLSTQNTRIILVVPRRKTALFVDILLEVKAYSRVYVILMGDVFGTQSTHTTLSKSIEEALLTHAISVSQDITVPIFPISDIDFLNLVAHILFGNAKESNYFKGYYNAPSTLISLVHVLKRYEPELSVEFIKKEKATHKDDTFFMSDRVIKERLGVIPESAQGILLGFAKSMVMIQEGLSNASFVPRKAQKKQKLNITLKSHKLIKRFLVFFLIGFLSYIFLTVLLFVLSVFLFKTGITQILEGKTQQAVKNLTTSKTLYDFSSKNTHMLLSIPSVSFIESGRQYLYIYDELQTNTLPAINVLSSIAASKKLSVENLTILEAFMRDFYFFTQQQENKNLSFLNKNQFVAISQLLPIMQTFRSLGGYDSEKAYLILLQNSNELRPTGGFIGSVAYLTVKNGELKTNKVEDVYDLDGQLKGHVEPHYVIRRNLQPNLYLRDSNFNPDFNISASSSAFLYNLESGKQVNGVIAIDTYVLKKLIEIAGPIQISGQSEKLTPENVTSLIQDSIQNEFFPGSIEKKQILNTLMSKILVTIESNTHKQMELISILPSLMTEKHIMFSFPNQSVQKVFQAAGFAGSLSDTRTKNKILPDFLSINEANIGVNKANEFITRKIDYSAVLYPDELWSDASLTLKNASKNDYRAYVRFIVPENAVLSGITMNGETQSVVPAVIDPAIFERKVFKAPAGLEVDQEIQDGKRMIGFIVNAPKGEELRIHVLYKTPFVGLMNGTFNYSLLYIKQPGTSKYPLTVQLESSEAFKVESARDGSVLFNDSISTDKEFVRKVVRQKE